MCRQHPILRVGSTPPGVITAIGDVPAMRAGLEGDKQVRIYREYVQAVGLGYQVRTRTKADFPAYAGSITPRYAVAKPLVTMQTGLGRLPALARSRRSRPWCSSSP